MKAGPAAGEAPYLIYFAQGRKDGLPIPLSFDYAEVNAPALNKSRPLDTSFEALRPADNGIVIPGPMFRGFWLLPWADIDAYRARATGPPRPGRSRRESENSAKDFPSAGVTMDKERMRTEDVDAPDNECVGRAQAGDAAAFTVLFDRYYDMIRTFAYRVCLAESEADDLTQETFIAPRGGIGRYRGTASFKNWLFSIAHHAVIDWQRQRARRRDKEAAFAAEMESQAGARAPDHGSVHAALARLPRTGARPSRWSTSRR
ncbi:MAG: RNA polymerase sigma factor [Verrucomicrobiota bacterium]